MWKREEREREKKREISRKIKAPRHHFFYWLDGESLSRHLLQPDNNPPDRINDCRPFSRGRSIFSAYDCTFGQPDSIRPSDPACMTSPPADTLPRILTWHICAFESHYFLTTRGIIRIHDAPVGREKYVYILYYIYRNLFALLIHIRTKLCYVKSCDVETVNVSKFLAYFYRRYHWNLHILLSPQNAANV